MTAEQVKRHVPRWLQMILDWRASRRQKELAKLDAELVRVKNELAIVQAETKWLELIQSRLTTFDKKEL